MLRRKVVKGGPYWPIASRIKERYRNSTQQDGPVTFKEFVQYLIDPRTRRFDVHWQQFHEMCQPCRIRYDFIGHYETLAQDTRYVLSRLGIDNVPLPSFNAKYNSSHHVAEIFAQLTENEIQRLVDVYRLDFALFGYSTNISEF